MVGRSRMALVTAGLALLGAGLAGCGGGDDEAAGTGEIIGLPATTGAEEVAPEPPPAPETVLVVKLVKGKPIGPGSKGAHVATLQKALKQLGYDVGTIDGEYGPVLAKAIASFQEDNRLTSDGIAGKKTIRRINRELKKQAAGET